MGSNGNDDGREGELMAWETRTADPGEAPPDRRAAAGMQEPLVELLPCSNGAATSRALSG